MNNTNVINLPASTNYNPEQALQRAMGCKLTDVIVIGYDEDRDLYVGSSKMTRAEALFLLEKGKEWAMYGGME